MVSVHHDPGVSSAGAPLTPDELRRLLAYLWERSRGKSRTFATLLCYPDINPRSDEGRQDPVFPVWQRWADNADYYFTPVESAHKLSTPAARTMTWFVLSRMMKDGRKTMSADVIAKGTSYSKPQAHRFVQLLKVGAFPVPLIAVTYVPYPAWRKSEHRVRTDTFEMVRDPVAFATARDVARQKKQDAASEAIEAARPQVLELQRAVVFGDVSEADYPAQRAAIERAIAAPLGVPSKALRAVQQSPKRKAVSRPTQAALGPVEVQRSTDHDAAMAKLDALRAAARRPPSVGDIRECKEKGCRRLVRLTGSGWVNDGGANAGELHTCDSRAVARVG